MVFQISSILALLACLCTSSAYIGGSQQIPQDINPQVYCGRNLAKAMAEICSFQNSYDKRSEPGTMYSAILSPYYKEQDAYGLPWLSPHKARALAPRGKRYNGIVEECCNKACSLNEMWAYCN